MKISINLLPPEQKRSLKREIAFRMLKEQFVYVAIILFVLLAGLLAIHLLLRSEIRTAERLIMEQEQAASYRDVQEALDVFRETNTQIRSLRAISNGSVAWSDFLEIFTASIPSTIRIQEIRSVDTKMTIRGIAKTRDDVVLLKKTLEGVALGGNTCFENVSIPEGDLVTAQDAQFSLEMTLTEHCLLAQTTAPSVTTKTE